MLNGSVTLFASGLQEGPFNALAINNKGDLIVSDFANLVEEAGRVIRIRKR
jgi:hypothetical protein